MRTSLLTAFGACVLLAGFCGAKARAQQTFEFPSYSDAMNCRFFSLTGMAHFMWSDTAQAQTLNADSYVFGVIGQVTFKGETDGWVADMKRRQDAHFARLEALPNGWLDRTIRKELAYCAELKQKHAGVYRVATTEARKHFSEEMDTPVTELSQRNN